MYLEMLMFAMPLYITCTLTHISSIVDSVAGLIYRSAEPDPLFKVMYLITVTSLWSDGSVIRVFSTF